jgi:hypothetical protein
MKKPNTISTFSTKSLRDSRIRKSLVNHRSDSNNKEKHKNENDEVLSPEARVGLAEKEKHSVSMYLILKIKNSSYHKFMFNNRTYTNYLSNILGICSKKICKFRELCLPRK